MDKIKIDIDKGKTTLNEKGDGFTYEVPVKITELVYESIVSFDISPNLSRDFFKNIATPIPKITKEDIGEVLGL